MLYLGRKIMGYDEEAGNQNDGSTALPLVLHRLESASQPHERRQAVDDLKPFAETSPGQVGEYALPTLLSSLQTDRDDLELCHSIMEILLCITDEQQHEDQLEEIVSNIELLVRDHNDQDTSADVTVLFNLLDETDFYLRYHAIQLVTKLLNKRKVRMQDIILKSPMGVSRLLDVLQDARDIIRNEALLLLSILTQCNEEIQKIVAFEGAFERFFDIVVEEGGLHGGVIAQDCLQCTLNLLADNVSNQKYFRETGCMRYLVQTLDNVNVESEETYGDSTSKLVQVIFRIIVTLADTRTSESAASRSVLSQQGMVERIVRFACAKMCPAIVKTQAILILSELMWNDRPAQNEVMQFVHSEISVDGDSSIYRCSALYAIVDCALNAEHPSDKLSALHALRTFFHDNPDGQLAVGATLQPRQSFANSGQVFGVDAAGHLLANVFMQAVANTSQVAPESLWGAMHIVMYVIDGSSDCKELLLRVAAGSDVRRTPSFSSMSDLNNGSAGGTQLLFDLFMKTLCSIIRAHSAPSTQIAFLKLLCIWMYNSQSVISSLMQTASSFLFFVETLTQEGSNVHVSGLCAVVLGILFLQMRGEDGHFKMNKFSMLDILTNRVGLDAYSEAWNSLRTSSDFQKALNWKSHTDSIALLREKCSHNRVASLDYFALAPIFDHSFAMFVESLHSLVENKILSLYAEQSRTQPSRGPVRNASTVDDVSPVSSRASNTSRTKTPSPSSHSTEKYNDKEGRQVQSLSQEVDALRAQLQRKDADLVRERQLKDSIASTDRHSAIKQEGELHAMIKAYNELESKSKEREHALESTTAELESLSRAYNDLEQRLRDMKLKQERLQDDLRTARTTNSLMEEKTKMERSKVANVEQKLLLAERDHLSALNEKIEECTSLETKYSSMKRENDDLKKAAVKQQADHRDLLRCLGMMELRMKALEEALEESSDSDETDDEEDGDTESEDDDESES